jgi:hypothetical protein
MKLKFGNLFLLISRFSNSSVFIPTCIRVRFISPLDGALHKEIASKTVYEHQQSQHLCLSVSDGRSRIFQSN